MMEKINLKVGEPSFYQDYWYNKNIPSPVTPDSIYDYPIVNSRLIESIINLHYSIHGISLTPSDIVIGNGASQLISASAYAQNVPLSIAKPYWPRIPELCMMGGYRNGLDFRENSPNQFVVSPNNPNGIVAPLEHILSATVVDACYNWPQYVEYGLVSRTMPKIALYSLSKAMGLAGLRLGWAITQNKDLAEKMRHYVEYSTAGVSVDAQAKAANYISFTDSQLMGGNDVFSWATEEFIYRWSKVMDAFDGTGILPTNNGKGMFIWLHSPSINNLPLHLDETYGIISMSGYDCGATNQFARINLACHGHEFDQLIRRVENAKTVTTDQSGTRGISTV